MCRQQTLPIFDYSDVVGHLANGDSEARGAIFTRREVVDFVLDLAGYTADQPLHHRRLLEPAFGDGDFLLSAVEQLLMVYMAQVPDCSRIAVTGSVSNHVLPLVTPDLQEEPYHAFPITTLP